MTRGEHPLLCLECSEMFTNELRCGYFNTLFNVHFIECWIDEGDNPNVNGFECLRRISRTKDKGGDIVCFYRPQLSEYISVESTQTDGILWIKLTGTLFEDKFNTFIGSVYVSPDRSTFYSVLENNISMYSNMGHTFITCVLSSRTERTPTLSQMIYYMKVTICM